MFADRYPVARDPHLAAGATAAGGPLATMAHMVELTPTQYQCAEHGTDLTDQVRDEVAEQIPAAFTRQGPRDFRVIVECPGGAKPHELAFLGQVRRVR